jgi:hypothetical protein
MAGPIPAPRGRVAYYAISYDRGPLPRVPPIGDRGTEAIGLPLVLGHRPMAY